MPEFISEIKEFQELDKTCSAELDELREKLLKLQTHLISPYLLPLLVLNILEIPYHYWYS